MCGSMVDIQSATAEIRQGKTIKKKKTMGPMPNVMAALPNIVGALCSAPQSWLTPTTTVPCSKAAKTQNPLKFAGMPQTNAPISAVGGPTELLCDGAEIAIIGDLLRPVFSASRVQHVSDRHSKFALRPHHVCKYGRHPVCDG